MSEVANVCALDSFYRYSRMSFFKHSNHHFSLCLLSIVTASRKAYPPVKYDSWRSPATRITSSLQGRDATRRTLQSAPSAPATACATL